MGVCQDNNKIIFCWKGYTFFFFSVYFNFPEYNSTQSLLRFFLLLLMTLFIIDVHVYPILLKKLYWLSLYLFLPVIKRVYTHLHIYMDYIRFFYYNYSFPEMPWTVYPNCLFFHLKESVHLPKYFIWFKTALKKRKAGDFPA